jgi:hypothetical protein
MAKKKKCKEPANLAEEMAWIAEEFKDRIADNAEWARREEIHRKAKVERKTIRKFIETEAYNGRRAYRHKFPLPMDTEVIETVREQFEDDGFTVVPQSNDPLGDERVEFLIKW